MQKLMNSMALAFTMGKWFLTDYFATVGPIFSADPNAISIPIKRKKISPLAQNFAILQIMHHAYSGFGQDNLVFFHREIFNFIPPNPKILPRGSKNRSKLFWPFSSTDR